eukprot:6169005-Pyramimonas_sp.AAC.1
MVKACAVDRKDWGALARVKWVDRRCQKLLRDAGSINEERLTCMRASMCRSNLLIAHLRALAATVAPRALAMC